MRWTSITSGIASTPALKRSSHAGVYSPASTLTSTESPTPTRLRVDDRDAAGDDPLGFQLLDAFPARGRRQPDPLRHLGDRQGRVALQDVDQLAVDVVHARLCLAQPGIF